MQIMSNLPASYSYQQRQNNNNLQFKGIGDILKKKAGVKSGLPEAMGKCEAMYEKFERTGAENVKEATKTTSKKSGVTGQAPSATSQTGKPCPQQFKRNKFGVPDSQQSQRILAAKENGTLGEGHATRSLSGSFAPDQIVPEQPPQYTSAAGARLEDRLKLKEEKKSPDIDYID